MACFIQSVTLSNKHPIAMSMQSIHITCERCNFSSSDAVTWGSFIYVLSNGKELYAGRELGWCHSCSNFVAFEFFPNQEGIERKIDEIGNKIEELKQEEKAYPPPSFLKKLFNINNKIDNTNKIELLRKELEEQFNKRLFLQERVSSPRCLNCGSIEVEGVKIENDSRIITEDDPIRESDFDLDKITNYWTYFIHPGCGGHFLLEESPYSIRYGFEPRYYDSEGNKIIS